MFKFNVPNNKKEFHVCVCTIVCYVAENSTGQLTLNYYQIV